MRKLKEVLRLRFELKLGYQQIGRSCSIGVSTVHKYLKRAEAAGVTWPLPEDWDEARVEAMVFPRREPSIAEHIINVQSFMGTIFMLGIAQSNSTLLVEFANRLRGRGLAPLEAVVEAAQVRLRPILMTAGAALLALLPLALNPSEPAMPLARAVIGGLASSTVLTLFFVPILYLRFKR